MPRIVGVDVPKKKQTWIALTYIYGIGKYSSLKICQTCGLDPHKKSNDLTEEEISLIAKELEKNYLIEGPLRRHISQNISRLKEIRCYRGYRHRQGLPVRGQRTKTNARTRKGPKKTVAVKKSIKALR